MHRNSKERIHRFLRWTERYTKTDMVYLAASGFWTQANSLFIASASFALYVLFAHVLPKEVYGTYQYLLSVAALVASFTLTGMSTTVGRAVTQGFEGSFRDSIRAQLIWGIIPLLGSWMISAYYVTQGNHTLAFALFLIGIFVPLNTTFNTYNSYLIAKKDFRRGFFFSLFVNVPYYAAVALVAVSIPAAVALLAANLISQFIGYLVAHWRTLRVYQPNDKRDPNALTHGGHLSVMSFLTSVLSQIDNILVFHFLGAAQVALYSFATAVPDRLTVYKNLTAVAFPKLANRTPLEIWQTLGRKVTLSFFGALGVAGAWTLIAHPFFAFFFPTYLAAVPYTQVYAFVIPAGFGAFFTLIFIAHGHMKALYTVNMVGAILQLILLAIGVIWWGLWGLIIARVAGGFIVSLFSGAMFLLVESKHVSSFQTPGKSF